MTMLNKYILFGLIVVISTSVFAIGDKDLKDILDLGRLPYLKDTQSYQISSYDTTGGNADCRYIKNGETLTLATIQGPGVITNIWVTISCPAPNYLRNIILQMHWDDESEPSVLSPIGDFFGTGFAEYHPTSSLLVGMSSGGYYCYIPMPFRKSARISVTNLSGKPVDAFYYHIDYFKLPKVDRDVAYFHAQWNRENPTHRGKDYTILDAIGRGHYIGTVLNMQSLSAGNLGFLEGDEHIRVDDQPLLSWNGTGTEDYFNSGWYFNQGTFSNPFHGLTIKDEEQSRISAYRFHLWDTIPFTKSIKVSIEHGDQNTESADYSSVAYWYQTEPHAPFFLPNDRNPHPPIPLYHMENLIEAESLIPSSAVTGGTIEKQFMGAWTSETSHDWSGMAQLFFHDTSIGSHIIMILSAPSTGSYNFIGYFTKAADYGIFRVSVDGNVLGEPFDGYNKNVIPSGPINMGQVGLKVGPHELRIDIIGKNPKSSNYYAGLDGFLLQPSFF